MENNTGNQDLDDNTFFTTGCHCFSALSADKAKKYVCVY